MIKNQFLLLKDNRFAPLFLTQFMGAFHDNLFKNALVVLLLYSASIQSVYDPKILVTLATAIFIVPFVLFSAIGGQLADKYPKDRVIRIIKIVEVAIALLGSVSIISGMLWLNFLTLFCLGTQSAFFGPSKYSIVPQHLKEDELIGGNALLNTGTFLAILIGTIAGTTLVTINGGQVVVSILLVVCALCGYIASRAIPHAAEKSPDLALNFNPFTQSVQSFKKLGFTFWGLCLCLNFQTSQKKLWEEMSIC
jgi:MFS family permease